MKITICKGRLEIMQEPEDAEKTYAEVFWEAVEAVRRWLAIQ